MELHFFWQKDVTHSRGEISLNFGGEYIFELKVDEGKLILSHELNEHRIGDFFNDEHYGGSCNISNLTALVGENGSGKSYVLDSLLSSLMLTRDFEVPTICVFKYTSANRWVIYYTSVSFDYSLFEMNADVPVFSIPKHPGYYISNELSLIFFSNIFDSSLFEKDYLRPVQLERSQVFDISTNYLLKKDSESYRSRSYAASSNVQAHREADFSRQYDMLFDNRFSGKIPFNLPTEVNLELPKNHMQVYKDMVKEFNDIHRKLCNIVFSLYENGHEHNKLLKYILALFISYFAILDKHLMREFKKEKENYMNVTEFATNLELDRNNPAEAILEILSVFHHYFGHEISELALELTDNVVFLIRFISTIDDQRYIKSDLFTNESNIKLKIFSTEQNDELSFSSFWKNYRKIYRFYPLINIRWGNVSSGEKALLNLYGRFHSISGKSMKDNILILIDEGDLYFHPEWQRKYISNIVEMIHLLFSNKNVQLIITSHSPFVVSDLLPNNVIRLRRDGVYSRNEDINRPSFGANIHLLFTDTFFLQGGLVGEFANKKISKVIQKLNSSTGWSMEEYSTTKKLIDAIGEPIIREKLNEMLVKNLMNKERSHLGILERHIQEYEETLKKLKAEHDRIVNRGQDSYDADK